MKAALTVIVPTLNEQSNLPDCLHSVCGWANQVLVVDSGSTDATVQVARGAGAEVLVHDYAGPAQQKNWAMAHPSIRNRWVLFVDADERVSPELAREIRDVISSSAHHAGYHVNRRFIFYGHWMRHSWYPSWNVRLVLRDKARYEERPVHEHMLVDGTVAYLRHDLIHNDFRDMTHWIATHNRYATGEAAELVRRQLGHASDGLPASLFGGPLERRRWVKNVLWPWLPARGLWMFAYLYFLKRGFLDGETGFHFCLMHAIFEHFISAKAWESNYLRRHDPGNYYKRAVESYLASHPEDAVNYENQVPSQVHNSCQKAVDK